MKLIESVGPAGFCGLESQRKSRLAALQSAGTRTDAAASMRSEVFKERLHWLR